jgi:hypothetical protein
LTVIIRLVGEDLRPGGASRVWAAVRGAVRSSTLGPQLRGAADGARLRPWTELLTAAVVQGSESLGWRCAARWVSPGPLGVARGEYLAIDVMAFGPGDGWRRPVAAFELENSPRDDLVAYALWKACMVRTDLACLFCYRPPEAIGSAVRMLQRDVLRPMAPDAEVLVVLGTRAAADTFPDGYFRPFVWDAAAEQLRAGLGTRS